MEATRFDTVHSPTLHAGVAQLVEHHVANVKIVGSSPTPRTNYKATYTTLIPSLTVSLLFIAVLV